jgi:uncharacterized membrane protein YqgA involved in biofilm formation
MVGTLMNTAAVIVGSAAGILLRKRIPSELGTDLIRVMGLFTFLIGMKNSWSSPDLLITLVCVVTGTIIGMVLKLDNKFNGLSEIARRKLGSIAEGSFTEGMMAATLLFCIGPMAIMGSLQDGLTGDYSILATKSVMDGITSLAMASTMGIGVAFSALAVFVIQGSITMAAGFIEPYMTQVMQAHITAAGGLMLLGLSFNLIMRANIKVSNMLPALLIAALVAAFI